VKVVDVAVIIDHEEIVDVVVWDRGLDWDWIGFGDWNWGGIGMEDESFGDYVSVGDKGCIFYFLVFFFLSRWWIKMRVLFEDEEEYREEDGGLSVCGIL